MPRKPRFYLAGVPAHVMQRGHNKKDIFFDEPDYREYLKILKKVSDHYGCAIHAYILMTNHVHLLLTPATEDSISLLFQSIGRLYVTYINKKYGRTGTLWEGRHKGNIIESEAYFLRCMKYIEQNPVRAKMVEKPVDYPWSSYPTNALGKPNAILTMHDLYLSISPNPSKRQEQYRTLFKDDDLSTNDVLSTTIESGTPLGGEDFLNSVARQFKTKIGFSKRGRPTKISG